jgi:hypothetical protein
MLLCVLSGALSNNQPFESERRISTCVLQQLRLRELNFYKPFQSRRTRLLSTRSKHMLVLFGKN